MLSSLNIGYTLGVMFRATSSMCLIVARNNPRFNDVYLHRQGRILFPGTINLGTYMQVKKELIFLMYGALFIAKPV